jgi:hypothetical protein
MRAICLTIGVAALVLAFAGAASADVIFSENFEAMTPGDVRGQGGWTPEGLGFFDNAINVGTGGGLTNMQILAVAASPGHASAALHPLGSLANLSGSGAYTLSWDAEYGSANADFGFYAGHDDVLGFGFESTATSWLLDPRGMVGGTASDRIILTGGTTGPVKFAVTVDGSAGTVAGYYDFGSGYTLAGSYAATSAQIESLVSLYVSNDYRSGGIGVGVDNIQLATGVNVVPEPGTLCLMGSGLIGLLAYAWRKRK